jgi:phosphoglycolate phosphatase-like HAD superfamily hydrolase
MFEPTVTELEAQLGGAPVLCTDVFDTLLLRTVRSERSRLTLGEKHFAELLSRHGLSLRVETLLRARLRAQQLAFRALNVGGIGEVRLTAVVSRQLHILGVPQSFVADRLQIELDVERSSLRPNLPLAECIRRRRGAGARVVAVSDTTLSEAQLRDLIAYFHGPDLVDHIYSSADLGVTKRSGELFFLVAKREGVLLSSMVHIGDDALADVRVPSRLGIRVVHFRRPSLLSHLRRADGATTELGRALRARRQVHFECGRAPLEREAFARAVFGPILLAFSTQLWLYAAQAEQTHTPVLLFCARGGIGIREAFERVVDHLGLPLETRRANLPVSRLVAARAALLAGGPSAIQELDREFQRDTLQDAAQAFRGQPCDLSAEWQAPFSARTFIELLHGPSGSEVLADIREQHALFERHVRAVAKGADRLILCDTGLYGSTQRLLAEGFPDLHFETLQFARANYKGHSEEHFPRVAGLLVEDNYYNPLSPPSCVLRYWQLVEALFEPNVPSVRSFRVCNETQVQSNAGDIEYGCLPSHAFAEHLTYALQFLDALTVDNAADALEAAERAWVHLQRAITRPGSAELDALHVGARSFDFGRQQTMEVVASKQASSVPERLRSIKAQHWREGAIARGFPVMKHALLPALSAVHIARRLIKTR